MAMARLTRVAAEAWGRSSRGWCASQRWQSVAAREVEGSQLQIFEGEGFRIVELARPEEANSLDPAMARDLERRLAGWEENAQVSCVVIRGQEGVFCGGADLNWLSEHRAQAPELYHALAQLYLGISRHPKPLVACMDGAVAGSGFGLAHTPFRVVTESTQLSVPEASFGLCVDGAAVHMLLAADAQSGLPVSRFLALTGTPISGPDMCFLGLATHLIPDVSVDFVMQALASGSAHTTTDYLGADVSTVRTMLDDYSRWRQPVPAGGGSWGRDQGRDQDQDQDLSDAIFSSFAETVEAAPWGPDSRESFLECFSQDSVEGIWQALESRAAHEAWAAESLEAMGAASPLALKTTLRLLQDCSGLSQAQGFQVCERVASRLSQGKAFDAAIEHASSGTTPDPCNLGDLEAVKEETTRELFAP